MPSTVVIIPARYASSRFPGKVIAQLAGKPMVRYVWETAVNCVGPENVWIAVDDARVADVCQDFGAKVVFTSPQCASGTERVREALDTIGCDADVIVNMQADEPMITPGHVQALIDCFDDPATGIATLCYPFPVDGSYAELADVNTPKVVLDDKGDAMLFSRSVIPYVAAAEGRGVVPGYPRHLMHLGLYAYRADTLRQIVALPQSPLEIAESLEQLRWLYAGYKIACRVVDAPTISVDTPEDLDRAQKLITDQ